MNLVLSGPIDDNLRNEVAASVKPRNVVRLHANAYRFEGADDSPQMRIRIRCTMCDASRVDHAYVEEGKRFSDFKLLAMDMDSTLITIECIDEIADFAGKKKEVAAITEAAMRGEIPDFAESLRRRVALLEGTHTNLLTRVFDERLTLSPGAPELIAAAKQSGAYVILLSGGFSYFTNRLKTELGLHAGFANHLAICKAHLTGKLIEPILGPEEKARHVKTQMTRLKCDPQDACAIGDGANDIPMMQQVLYSVAYHAKPTTIRAARYAITYGALTTLLDYLSD